MTSTPLTQPISKCDLDNSRPYDWLKVSTDQRVHSALSSVIEQIVSTRSSTSLTNRRTPDVRVREYLLEYLDNKYKNNNITTSELNECLYEFADVRRSIASQLGYSGTNSIGLSERLVDHICALCLDLFYSYRQSPYKWLGISLNNNSQCYRGKSKYNKTKRSITFTNSALDMLYEHGFVEVDLGKWNPTGEPGQCTTMRATPKLVDFFSGVCPTLITHDYTRAETIILRSSEDSEGNIEDIDYEETQFTRDARSDLGEINSCLSNANISLSYSDCEMVYRLICKECESKGEPIPDPLPIPDFTRKHYYRIFNDGRFDLGGRGYRPFWQSIDKRYRPALRIDGEPTVEIDISFLHPLLLYWRKAVALWFDPYNPRLVGGDPAMRRKSKLVFQRMLNTTSRSSAENAVRNDDFKNGERVDIPPEDRLGPPCVPLVGMLDELNRPIQDELYSMGGLGLQFVDSQIAQEIMLTLARKGVAVLSIHDSFIVKERHRDLLVWAIDRALHRLMPKTGRLEHQYARGIMYKAKDANGTEERFPSPLRGLYLKRFSYRASDEDVQMYLDKGAPISIPFCEAA